MSTPSFAAPSFSANASAIFAGSRTLGLLTPCALAALLLPRGRLCVGGSLSHFVRRPSSSSWPTSKICPPPHQKHAYACVIIIGSTPSRPCASWIACTTQGMLTWFSRGLGGGLASNRKSMVHHGSFLGLGVKELCSPTWVLLHK